MVCWNQEFKKLFCRLYPLRTVITLGNECCHCHFYVICFHSQVLVVSISLGMSVKIELLYMQISAI